MMCTRKKNDSKKKDMSTRIKYFVMIGWMLLGMAFQVMAQDYSISVSGVVRDSENGRRIAQASVGTPDGHVATVTNADGRFTLKLPQRPKSIVISCLGYRSAHVNLDDDLSKEIKVRLVPSSITLSELIVSNMNPYEIVEAAVQKIKTNNSRNNELLRCFYRETTQKGRRFIYVAEAVTDLYKAGYDRLTAVDRVAIEKGRKLVSVRPTDTLGAKIQGGPTLPVMLDMVKNRDLLINKDELALYHLQMEPPQSIDDRSQLVISFSPAYITDHVLYHGKMYIDRQTLAFTRFEMSLDMSDEERATAFILLRKPLGVRFRPKDLSITVAYRYDNGVSRMHYLHSDVRFYCEWRRKLFASPYHVEAEMVVTDLVSEDAEPIRGRESFNYHDSFFDKVQYFTDPDFWEAYNIIEPSESLEHAIGKLRKK